MPAAPAATASFSKWGWRMWQLFTCTVRWGLSPIGPSPIITHRAITRGACVSTCADATDSSHLRERDAVNLDYANLVWRICLLCIVLLTLPFILYMVFGWSDTRRTILCRMRAETIELYFGFFPPDASPNEVDSGALMARFKKFYDWHFGVRRFLIPALIFWTFAIGGLVWCAYTLDLWLSTPAALPGPWVWLAVAALMGAFMRTLYDQIVDSVRREMAPSSLIWAAFRIAVAVPIAYSLATPLKSEFGPSLAFLLGFFPTRELFSFARRVAVKRFDFGESGEAAENELQLRIQGIDQRQAERFADNRVTTVLQLAYSDPVKLAIRGGFEFDYVVDCISQALLWIYLEADLNKVRKFGFRGAQEASNLWDELQERVTDDLVDADTQARAALQQAMQSLQDAQTAASADPSNPQVNHKLEQAGKARADAEEKSRAAASALQNATLASAVTRAAAESAFSAAAAMLTIEPAAFRRTIAEVAGDPFVELIQAIWSDSCNQ